MNQLLTCVYGNDVLAYVDVVGEEYIEDENADTGGDGEAATHYPQYPVFAPETQSNK